MNGVELVASWLTPTVLFCVLNFMIGTIFISSTLNSHRKRQNLGDDKDEQPSPEVRIPSFFERVKSINLSRQQFQKPDPTHYDIPSEEREARNQEPDHDTEETHHVTRSNSDTVAKTAPARVLKKSADKVEMDERRPARVREKMAAEVDEAVDAKAGDFINRFRQQLKLQRLGSILRCKEMLNRATGR